MPQKKSILPEAAIIPLYREPNQGNLGESANYEVNTKVYPKIALHTIEGINFERIEDIVCFKADSSYTHVFFKDGRKVLVSKSLKEFEKKLNSYFVRVHRSYIVNLTLVQKYVNGRGGYLVMEDGSSIEVAARKKEGLLKAFEAYFC